jgi:hypothetical protein
MSWKKIDPFDNRPRYIHGSGGFYYLSKDSKNALENIPEGFKIVLTENKRLRLVRDK